MSDEKWAAQFPELFAPAWVDYANADTLVTTEPIDEAEVNRLHVIGVTAQGTVVVCGSDLGWRFLPGGRREPGESVGDLIDREMLEEAGATCTGTMRIFASQVAISRDEHPHKPHFAHPRGQWAFAVVPVSIIGDPTSPEDGEQITEVHALAPDEAAAYLAVHDPVHADMVRLAGAMGLLP